MNQNQWFGCAIIIVLIVSGCTTGQFVNKDECITLEDIAFNPVCDNKEVTVSGTVYDVEHKVSQKGNSYTTFELEEDMWEVTVFKFGYVDVADSQCAVVSGTYKIKNEVFSVFYITLQYLTAFYSLV